MTRLTKAEILSWTANNTKRSQMNKTNDKKRRSEQGYLTRSKRRKLDEMQTAPTKDDSEVKSKKSKINKATNEIALSKRQATQRPKKGVIAQKCPSNALMPGLHKYELVWAYVRGYPSWPGVVEEILSNGKYRIHFFGDYTRADVTGRCITNYFEGFHQFSSHFGNLKLRKAVEEAKFFLLGVNDVIDECFVCKILNHKKQFYQQQQ